MSLSMKGVDGNTLATPLADEDYENMEFSIKNVGGISELGEWPVGLCDCFSYRDSVDNSCKWFPFFVPMAVCGTCMIVGRIHSRMEEERVLCCDMGCSGWLCCALATPINFFAPLGGACYFSSLAAIFRTEITEKYNLSKHESNKCCFGEGCLNTGCECMHNACNYPCSFFQIYMTLRELQYDKVNPGSDKGVVSSMASADYRIETVEPMDGISRRSRG